MNILLVQPPLSSTIIGAGVAYLTEPLALEVIGAAVPDHEVRILDMRLDTGLDSVLMQFKPALVGVTGNTSDVYRMFDLMDRIKEFNRDILTVVGGHHATMMPRDFYRGSVDVIVLGEGEITFRDLVAAYEKKQNFSSVDGIVFRSATGEFIPTRPRIPHPNLDEMPRPARHLTQQHRNNYFRGSWRPVASLMTSKGCPFRCHFCALWKINGGKYYMRSSESVVAELAGLPEKYIDFAEDNALHNIPRAEKMCRMIKEHGIKKTYKLYARSDTVVRNPHIIEAWKEIGMELILIGLESFRDSELKGLNKNNTVRNNERAVRILQENDVEIAAYFIVNPDYSEQDFEKLGDYVVNLNLTQPIFTVLTPLPGTDLYQQKYKELTTHNYTLFDFVHSVLPTRLPLPKFYECLLNLYRKCYSSGAGSSIISSDSMFKQVHSMLSSAHHCEVEARTI